MQPYSFQLECLKPFRPEWGLKISPMHKRTKLSLGGFFICLTDVHRDQATLSRRVGATEPSKYGDMGKIQDNVKTPFHYGGGLSHQLSSI